MHKFYECDVLRFFIKVFLLGIFSLNQVGMYINNWINKTPHDPYNATECLARGLVPDGEKVEDVSRICELEMCDNLDFWKTNRPDFL